MFRTRAARLLTVTTAALLALMLVGPAATSAATPGWNFTGTTELGPSLIKVGADDAWNIVINNGGTSNISALYLSTDISDSPVYVGAVHYSYSGGTLNPCSAAGVGKLLCSFGALPAGGQIVIDAVAYQVTSLTFKFNFQLFGNGNTPSDKGGKSHGDTLNYPVDLTGHTTTDGNYGGGWSPDNSPVSNDGLTRNNLQGESVNPPTGLIQVTVQDGLTSAPTNCSGALCSGGFGDWMRLNVGQGSTFGTAFKYVITISGKNVPGGANTGNIALIHVRDDGSTYEISRACTYDTNNQPTNAECITVTKVGNNFQIVAWLFSNGGSRLTY